MAINHFTLQEKKYLTQDVFELVYEAENDFEIIPGQFITFLLPKTWFARAYSVLYKDAKKIYCIIKRLENGRGGSKEICDYEEGIVLRGVGPTGHFIDSKKENNKLYIATGTGIVPLYFLVRDLLSKWFRKSLKIILGNRTQKDLYYIEEFQNLKNQFSNFDFEVFLSREEASSFQKWYVWDFLTQENIQKFEEFYICGNPNMVDEVESKLIQNSVNQENIFREKY